MTKWILMLLGAVCLPAMGVGQMSRIPGDRPPMPGEEGEVLSALERSPAGSPRIEALLEAGYYYLLLPDEETADLDRALDYARQARQQSKAQGYEDGYADGLLLAGLALNEGKKRDIAKIALDSAMYWARRIKEQANATRSSRREARVLREEAMRFESLGQFGEAEKVFVDLVQLYKTMGYPYLHYAYERLAIIQMVLNNYDRALYYILECLKSMERTGDDSEAASFYFDLGYIYRQLGQMQEGMDYFNKALVLYERRPNPVLFDLAYEIAGTLAKMGRAEEGLRLIDSTLRKFTPKSRYEKRVIEDGYAICYRILHRYDLADLHLKKAAELVGKDHTLYLYDVMATGQLYLEWGKLDSARVYLESCLNFTDWPKSSLSQLHFLLYRVDSAEGHYLSAIDHLMKNKSLDDTLYQEAKARISKELEVRYETEKKDNQLRQANVYRNMTIGGIALLTIILLLVYRQYKMEVKSKRAINEKNGSLQRLLDEKEWLLKEVHHRVKNNLHIITSLLESQSALADSDARNAIQDSQHRVYAMSLVHQKLYQGAVTATIDFGMYLRELVLYLRESFDAGAQIHFEIEADEIEIDAGQAAHLGLILNEAITNAIKYAFAGRPKGTIHISVRRQYDDHLLLVVKDDGRGLPADFDMERSKSLGMRLMKGLSEDYEGDLKISSGEGTTVTLYCRMDRVLHYLEN